ncbi:MAG: hypothetical protein HYW65_03180 [Candidatus Liptonbacteria bacterium]|nr:hypothetical protein [Candidatus Liptonbacteria bacterium]
MRKIIVTKTETASSVAHKVLGIMDREVVLVIPKQSKVGSSLNNLHLLHREAEKAGKHLIVESVDEEVLAFAKLAGIASSHPFLGRASGLQDIVPRARNAPGEEPPRHFRAVKSKGVSPSEEVSLESEEENAEQEEVAIARAPSRARTAEARARVRHRMRAAFLAVLVAALLFAGVWATGAFFGTATVSVRLQAAPWEYQGVFIADAAAPAADPAQRMLPAEIFSLNRNLTQQFPATGTARVEEYAKGTVVIYNSYSSTPQTLVATTRFITQDGKVFRLVDRVVVPGALVRGGAITPATTTAAVVADKPGAEYNLASIAKLTIPAFRGSPKFNGFYGAMPGGTRGGYVGAKKVATAKDIEAAKVRIAEVLNASLDTLFEATKPEEFMIPDGARAIAVKKVAVSEATDTGGNFNVFGEATLTAPGFRRDDLTRMLVGYAEADRGSKNLMFRTLSLEAKMEKFDAPARRATVTVSARGVVAPVFSEEDFKASIAGLDVRAAQAAIGRIQGLAEGKISLWPFWVQDVPSDAGRITVAVE